MDDLKALFPGERRVEAGGEQFTLRPFGFRHMTKAMPHFAALLGHIETVEVDGMLRLKMDLDELLTACGDHLTILMALATGKEYAWAENLDFIEGCELAGAVLELNADFFARARAKGSKPSPNPASSGATSSPS